MTTTVLGDVPPPKTAKTCTLALDNRPKTWSELVGQPIPVTVLVNSLALNDIKPGYVFDGITGCGKTSGSILFAKRLNCENPNLTTQDPCNVCRSCSQIDRGISPDVKFVDGATDRSVHFIRETLKPFLLTAPYSKYKVAIIDEAHLYKSDSISAFLTLLENMPRHSGKSVVIMTTTDGKAMDSAVMNRCMNLHFASIPNDLLTDRMAAYTKQDRDVLAILAQECGNSFRSMWSYIEVWQHLGQPLTEALVMKLVGGIDTHERSALWSDVSNKRVDKLGERWRKWLQTGARAEAIGALLIRDLISMAVLAPDSTDWHKPMLLLAGAQQVSADSAWLQALYLMTGLPLDAQACLRPRPAEGQPQVLPVTTDSPYTVLTERLLFFGA